MEHYLSGAQLTDGTDTKPLTDKSEYLKAFYGVLLSSEQKKTKKKDGNAKHAYCRLFAVKAASKQHLGVGTGGGCCLLLHRIESAMHLQLLAETRCFVRSKLFSGGSGCCRESPTRLVGYIRVSDWWATGGRGSARLWPPHGRAQARQAALG